MDYVNIEYDKVDMVLLGLDKVGFRVQGIIRYK